METQKNIVFCLTVFWCTLAIVGCGKKADENKPIGQVKAKAEKMNVEQLRSMAIEYKNAILAKKNEVDKLTAKLSDIPVTKMLGDQAKGLKADIDSLNKSVTALNERFKIYSEKLKEKGGDLSGLGL